jgi:hypothetical protein
VAVQICPAPKGTFLAVPVFGEPHIAGQNDWIFAGVEIPVVESWTHRSPLNLEASLYAVSLPAGIKN